MLEAVAEREKAKDDKQAIRDATWSTQERSQLTTLFQASRANSAAASHTGPVRCTAL